jgi:hypothetical protein
MTTPGTIVFEVKIAVDIVQAKDGKYYVDATTAKSDGIVRESTQGPFATEAKARESLQWQLAVQAAAIVLLADACPSGRPKE